MDRILRAWADVISREGWAGARIDLVADAAGVATDVVAATLPDRFAAVAAMFHYTERAALAEAGERGSVRDRLFAMIMAGVDAAQDLRPAMTVLVAAAPRDPALALFLALHLPIPLGRIAEAGSIAGAGGVVRVPALGAICLAVAKVWLDDDSADLGPTMKELDRRLAQAETWARRLPHRVASAKPRALPALPVAAPPPPPGPPVG